MRLLIAFLVLAVLALPAPGAPAGLTGRLLERIACTADHTQTYALYVPTRYTRETKWPVIYCFDPGARGAVPVARLQATAEAMGCIVVGSNNSRNGPWSENIAAIEAMVRDVTSHLAVDAGRTYAMGLSGGARVAAEMGLMGLAQGVIGCGAGFPVTPDGIPARVPFAFFGTAGTTDFNYRELQRLEADLAERGTAHRVVFFAGGHEWPPETLLAEAVEWQELQAMHRGARPKDEAMIAAALQRRLAAMRAALAGPAWREATAITADFQGLTDTTEVTQEAKAWSASREVKAWLRAERARGQREDELTAELNQAVVDGSPADVRDVAQELRRLSDASSDLADRDMAQRVSSGFAGASRENLRGLFERRAYREAASLLEAVVELRPGQPRTWFDLARAYALDGRREKALGALKRAAESGFGDATRAESEPAFAALRVDPEFQRTLAAMRVNPAEPDRSWRGRP